MSSSTADIESNIRRDIVNPVDRALSSGALPLDPLNLRGMVKERLSPTPLPGVPDPMAGQAQAEIDRVTRFVDALGQQRRLTPGRAQTLLTMGVQPQTNNTLLTVRKGG